jgi:RNA polymerase sigma-70 factor (ECF subfamily)
MTMLDTTLDRHREACLADHDGIPSHDTAKSGCDLEVELVYRQYATRIYAVAFRMLGSPADAEDVTQEVLLQVVRRLDTFRGESSLHTWLYRVTVNAVLALRRKRAGCHEWQITADDAQPAAGRSRPAPPPEAAVLGGELRDHLDRAIRRLPEFYRDVFILADVEQLSNAEIGRMLGLSLPAVKSRLHRARLLLREALQPYFAEWTAPPPAARATHV